MSSSKSKPMSRWEPEKDQRILRRVGKNGEECAELARVCLRITIQGLDGVDPATGDSNRLALEKEIADVMAQCKVTIDALGLSREFIDQRMLLKESQMAEWESMFLPQSAEGPFSPRPGDLVRYASGSTALALHGEPHAGGWHGQQCMGGTAFYSEVYQPSREDRLTWVECAVKWRKVGLAQAMAEAGLPLSKSL